MYQPEAYRITLLFMIGSMLCWGSWANTMKLTPGWSFQLFYWDYVLGIVAASLLWGLTLGSAGGGELSLLRNIGSADSTHIVFALLGGVGVLLNYFISPQGSPLLLFGGVLLVVLAIVVDAMAYRRRETIRKTPSTRGIQISLACGMLMGVFYPLVAKAITGEHALGPYSVAFLFAIGTALCAVPVNYFFMRRPLTGGQPVSMADYWKGRIAWHWWGILGGMIWCTGAVLNFVASHAHVIGPAISYAIGQGATLIPPSGEFLSGRNLPVYLRAREG